MQNNISVIWRMGGSDVLETKFQSASRQIDNQWPFIIGVAISSHDDDFGPKDTKLIENALAANIAKMPDFISVPGHFFDRFRQTIVGVRQNEDARYIT